MTPFALRRCCCSSPRGRPLPPSCNSGVCFAPPIPPGREPGPIFFPQHHTGDEQPPATGGPGQAQDGVRSLVGEGGAYGRAPPRGQATPRPQATGDETRKCRPPIGSCAGKALPIAARNGAARLSPLPLSSRPVARRGFGRLRRQGHVTFCLHPLSCWGPSSPRRLSPTQTAAAGTRRPLRRVGPGRTAQGVRRPSACAGCRSLGDRPAAPCAGDRSAIPPAFYPRRVSPQPPREGFGARCRTGECPAG